MVRQDLALWIGCAPALRMNPSPASRDRMRASRRPASSSGASRSSRILVLPKRRFQLSSIAARPLGCEHQGQFLDARQAREVGESHALPERTA